jgi:NAD(P)-dependent dehydrogenase (short-subunit alcohol dehydrogenase family)
MSQTHPKQIMVMTGATSGIGGQAVKQLAALPDTLVLTGVRGNGRTVSGAEDIMGVNS